MDSATQETNPQVQAGQAAWRAAMLEAQQLFADSLTAAIATRMLDEAAYRRWLLAERRLVEDQIHALAPIQAACASPRALAQWLTDHLQVLRAGRGALDADLQDLPVSIAPTRHRLWPSGAQPARHAVLGAVALLDALTGGPAQGALIAMLNLAHLPAGRRRYLQLRREQLALHMPWRRRALAHLGFDAPAWAALVEGAQHAAQVQRAACEAALADA